jgi:hypothetical protein
MQQMKYSRIEPTLSAEEEWRRSIQKLSDEGLLGKAKSSWYMGANVEGKAVEPLGFPGGVPLYQELCDACAKNGYDGFEFVKAST